MDKRCNVVIPTLRLLFSNRFHSISWNGFLVQQNTTRLPIIKYEISENNTRVPCENYLIAPSFIKSYLWTSQEFLNLFSYSNYERGFRFRGFYPVLVNSRDFRKSHKLFIDGRTKIVHRKNEIKPKKSVQMNITIKTILNVFSLSMIISKDKNTYFYGQGKN